MLIQILRVESVGLDNVSNFPKLKSLEEFHVAKNKLCDVEAIAELFPNLELLDLRHNSLESLQEVVAALSKLCFLSELLLEGNALCSKCLE